VGSIRIADIAYSKYRTASVPDPDSAGPVGSQPARSAISLTKTFLDNNGLVNFGEEIADVWVWRDRPLEIRLSDGLPGEALYLNTLELETHNKKLLGKTAVVAFRPYSVDWFGFSRFRTVNRVGIVQRNRLVAKALQPLYENRTTDFSITAQERSAATLVWRVLSDYPQDLFGNENFYYARFYGYDRTDGLALHEKSAENQDRPTSLHVGTNANRCVPNYLESSFELSFGVCDNLEACRNALRNSEYLMKKLDSVKGMGNGPRIIAHDGTPIPTTATTYDLAEAVWEAAIVMALAGPGVGERTQFEKHQDLVARHGAVAVLASWIFQDSMRDLHKRRIRVENSVFLEALLHPRVREMGS
jgi:hypothetical protein